MLSPTAGTGVPLWECFTRLLVEDQICRSKILFQMCERRSSRDEQDGWRLVEQQGKRNLRRCCTESIRRSLDGGRAENWILGVEGGTQRKKRDKRNSVRPARVEDALS